MNQNIINARVTFRNSPIHILEQFTIKDIEEAYEKFKNNSELDECVIIQTCNRIELFGKSKTHDSDKIKKTWASITGLEEEAFNENIEFGFQPLGGIAGVNLMKLMFGFKRWLGTKISNTLVHLKCATECYHIVVT